MPNPRKRTPARDLAPVYQLKATLREVSPPVWRRVVLPGDRDLGFLSRVLDACFRWSGSHQHQFRFEGCCFGEPDPHGAQEPEGDEGGVTLLQQAPEEGTSFIYLYDFADDWTHDVLVEEIRGPEIVGDRGPLCLAGERAAPPEDCGGPEGYDHLLKVLGDHRHPEHARLVRWVGGEFDPEAVDLRGINRRLAKIEKGAGG